MTAIILGWNPDRTEQDRPNAGPALREPWPARDPWQGRSYAVAIEEVASRGLSVQPWALPGGAPVGTDVWLVLEGSNVRGLAGHGVVARSNAEQQLVAFDALLPLGDQVPADVLTEAVPGFAWHNTGAEYADPGPGDELNIRDLWARFGPGQGPDPTQPAPGTYPGSAVVRVAVNRYERDPEARRACIAHRGNNCAACGFSFEVMYGEIGADFIDVHHTVPASQLGTNYQLDPLTDLVPLCANCHAMAHYGVNTARTEVELRRAIANSGHLRGRTVSPEELEAQRDAREILGPPS
jgi:5-methylcytosine-specific restriction protein A